MGDKASTNENSINNKQYKMKQNLKKKCTFKPPNTVKKRLKVSESNEEIRNDTDIEKETTVKVTKESKQSIRRLKAKKNKISVSEGEANILQKEYDSQNCNSFTTEESHFIFGNVTKETTPVEKIKEILSQKQSNGINTITHGINTQQCIEQETVDLFQNDMNKIFQCKNNICSSSFPDQNEIQATEKLTSDLLNLNENINFSSDKNKKSTEYNTKETEKIAKDFNYLGKEKDIEILQSQCIRIENSINQIVDTHAKSEITLIESDNSIKEDSINEQRGQELALDEMNKSIERTNEIIIDLQTYTKEHFFSVEKIKSFHTSKINFCSFDQDIKQNVRNCMNKDNIIQNKNEITEMNIDKQIEQIEDKIIENNDDDDNLNDTDRKNNGEKYKMSLQFNTGKAYEIKEKVPCNAMSSSKINETEENIISDERKNTKHFKREMHCQNYTLENNIDTSAHFSHDNKYLLNTKKAIKETTHLCLLENDNNINEEKIYSEGIHAICINDDQNKPTELKERKLTLFYMNALDYDKKFQNDNTTGSEMKKAQEITTSNISEDEKCMAQIQEQNSVKILNIKDDINNLNTYKELLEAKSASNLVKQEDPSDEKNSSNDLKQANIKNDSSELLYDEYSIKSVKNDKFQTNSLEVTVKHNITNDSFKWAIQEDNSQQHDKPHNAKKTISDEYSLHNEESNMEQTQDTVKNSETNQHQDNKCHHDQDNNEDKVNSTVFLVTAMDCFQKKDMAQTEEVSVQELENNIDNMNEDGKNDSCSKDNDQTQFCEAEDSFDMDDGFDLTSSQLNMIDVDEIKQLKISNERQNSSQQTEHCNSIHFGFDSVTVELTNQLGYIREAVESIKEILTTTLKKE